MASLGHVVYAIVVAYCELWCNFYDVGDLCINDLYFVHAAVSLLKVWVFYF